MLNLGIDICCKNCVYYTHSNTCSGMQDDIDIDVQVEDCYDRSIRLSIYIDHPDTFFCQGFEKKE